MIGDQETLENGRVLSNKNKERRKFENALLENKNHSGNKKKSSIKVGRNHLKDLVTDSSSTADKTNGFVLNSTISS